MAQKKKPAKIYYGDQFAITSLKGHNYSIRVRLDPDAEFGGPHQRWYWSKSKKVTAPSLAKAIVEAEQYRDELLEGNYKTDLTVAQYARQWQEERILQAEATYKSNGVAKPSFRTIDRDEIEIQRIEKLFPKVTIENLKPENIETVITRMRKDGVSEQTIYKMFKKLRQILKRPAIAGAIKYNPCDLVDIIHEPKINPVTKNYRRITEETAADFVSWLFEQELNGRIIALWIGLTTHMRLGEVLALRACDIDFKDDAIHIRGTINKKGEIVPAKADSERTLAMGPFLKDLLSTWFEIQQKEFPTLVKKWRREKISCGKTWDETAPVCSSYYGTHLNTDNFGKWMRSLMVERGLGEYTTKEEWMDSRGIKREKLGGYVGPSFKSLRSFGATYLISEKFDVKTAQGHLGHRRPTTTLGMYAESVPAHEREVASAMDSFIKNAINKQEPIQLQEGKSLNTLQNAITEQSPEEWPEWVQELIAIASEKNRAL